MIIISKKELDKLDTSIVYNIGLAIIKDAEIRKRFTQLIKHTNVENMKEAYEIVYEELMQQ